MVFNDMKKGDVVLVLQLDFPRGRWPLGRIIEIFPGRDGHTRVVKVQCGDKTYVRPIHKLVPLRDNWTLICNDDTRWCPPPSVGRGYVEEVVDIDLVLFCLFILGNFRKTLDDSFD